MFIFSKRTIRVGLPNTQPVNSDSESENLLCFLNNERGKYRIARNLHNLTIKVRNIQLYSVYNVTASI